MLLDYSCVGSKGREPEKSKSASNSVDTGEGQRAARAEKVSESLGRDARSGSGWTGRRNKEMTAAGLATPLSSLQPSSAPPGPSPQAHATTRHRQCREEKPDTRHHLQPTLQVAVPRSPNHGYTSNLKGVISRTFINRKKETPPALGAGGGGREGSSPDGLAGSRPFTYAPRVSARRPASAAARYVLWRGRDGRQERGMDLMQLTSSHGCTTSKESSKLNH